MSTTMYDLQGLYNSICRVEQWGGLQDFPENDFWKIILQSSKCYKNLLMMQQKAAAGSMIAQVVLKDSQMAEEFLEDVKALDMQIELMEDILDKFTKILEAKTA